MPFEWNNMLVVTKDELVPTWFSWHNLSITLNRYLDKPYGIKRVQLGGNGRQLLISFDSLPKEIQDGLGDPRKCNHILEKFYKVDGDAVAFFANYKFTDGSYLKIEHQEKYIVNASTLKAVLALRNARKIERKSKGGSMHGSKDGTVLSVSESLWKDAHSFQKTLKVKHGVQHTLPENERRFKDALKRFEKEGYVALISKKHKNQNPLKVTDATLELLKNMFAGVSKKPTATEVARQYDTFLSGYLTVINNKTGEVYNPSGFKKLSKQTVTNYMSEWESSIGTHACRSGDRQKYQQKFKPYHSLDKPKFAGSIISVDDRQPPFKTLTGKRVWFYNGIDLGSEAFTCWVYGETKEGIITEFYRQLVRNYAEWGFNLPAELEAEMSLNSSFVNTFLREGAMFQHVRIEANNARGKRIEAYYRQLRYSIEKDRKGWLARPHAVKESNQAGAGKVTELPYNDIIQGCLLDIEKWNNMPHSVHTHMSRWEVFQEMQNPDLKPTNYQSILPYIGYKTATSCKAGIIKLQRREFLLGDNGRVCKGEPLIDLMRQVEGREIDVYWLDDNKGGILKALIFKGSQYICEAVAKPTYSRAKIEQTSQDLEARTIMSAYVSTIEAFGKRQRNSIDYLTIIDDSPELKKTFIMPGLRITEIDNDTPVEMLPMPIDEEFDDDRTDFVIALKDRF